MLDLALRNARIVDGTGRPASVGAIGVRDGRIVSVGTVDEPAARDLDVDGLTVIPGIIDLHAHYDAQLFWDPALSPSPLHGVTTVVAGNCGLTLAPAKPADRDFLTRLLARVESIPVEALIAGVEYRWETFPEFLDVVERSPLGPNIGFMVGHSALRRAVMGEAASSEKATDEQLDAMRSLLSEAIAAGGLGFSTANVATQVDGDGRPTPPNFATREEFVGLAEVCGWHPGTCIEFIPGSFLVGFSDDDIELMTAMSAAANRHLNWNTPLVNKAAPDMYRRQIAASDFARERGAWVVPMYMPQNGPTQQDFLRGYVYRALPGWGFLFAMGVDAREKALADPAVRARLVAALDAETRGLAVTMRTSWGDNIVNDVGAGGPSELEGRRIHDIAVERGVGDFDAVCDIAVASHLDVGFVRYTVKDGDEWSQSARLEVLKDPRVVLGASDAGAHMDMMVGADFPTRCLAELVRDRGVFTLEELVHQFTDRLARLYGFRHRGRIEEGHWADLVVLDPATVGAGPLRTVRDLPAAAPRLKTESTGVQTVLVAGEAIEDDGKITGATPGRLLRSGRDTDTVPARPAAS
jgi:N-acyl-D-aspartate/D-glutamate deacylase